MHAAWHSVTMKDDNNDSDNNTDRESIKIIAHWDSWQDKWVHDHYIDWVRTTHVLIKPFFKDEHKLS